MRDWFDYTLKKKKINNLNRLKYNDNILINYDEKKYFEFKEFKSLKHVSISFKYLNKVLKKKKKILCIGSGWGYLEFLLSKKFNVTASDYNNHYVKFHKKNNSKNFKYIKLDILKTKLPFQKNYFKQVLINNIEYLLDNSQMNKCIKNLKKLGGKKTDYFLIFRSRDGFIIKLIEKYLVYFEIKLRQIFKLIRGERLRLTKNHHGFRRSKKEFLELLEKNNLKIISVYEDMYETEYERLAIVRKLKLSKFLSLLFFKSHPYLHIIHFK
jgi:2-polyprenyl-3-methyl-5-hydroxy-6-metoxy-1,4-benzoquinol methylase